MLEHVWARLILTSIELETLLISEVVHLAGVLL